MPEEEKMSREERLHFHLGIAAHMLMMHGQGPDLRPEAAAQRARLLVKEFGPFEDDLGDASCREYQLRITV